MISVSRKGRNRRIRKGTHPAATAVLAAALYGISAPASKLLLAEIPPVLLAALLYLGAGLGMLVVNLAGGRLRKERAEAGMTRKELPGAVGMILLDIAAPVLLMLGLSMSTAANASLLNNFEIVATSLIALLLFKEAVGRRMWVAIALITLSSIVLTVQGPDGLSFSPGSVLVLAACVCWGFENNLTRTLSLKNPAQIVVVKGLGSGTGSLLIAFGLREYSQNTLAIILALLLGFVAYGLSIFFYIKAQRGMGAARTSAYYAAAPFIGVAVSWLVLQEGMTRTFPAALLLMLAGAYFAVTEKHAHEHVHPEQTHEHMHSHQDGHHAHDHTPGITGTHSHGHTHDEGTHGHPHLPDMHHTHGHAHKRGKKSKPGGQT
ncbi:MAG: EamA family transporter [Clostridia bacterium]